MAHAQSTDPNIFILPDLGEGVHEAELIAWRVKVGDTVEEHQILADMETDKALVEVPSPRPGVIAILHGSEGEVLNVGNPLVTYKGDGSKSASAKPAPKKADTHGATSNGESQREDAGTVVGSVGSDVAGITAQAGKALATPAVRRLARDLGVDINMVEGTGMGGRVLATDVKAFAGGGGAKIRPAVQQTQQMSTTPGAASYSPPSSHTFAQPMQPMQPISQAQMQQSFGAMPQQQMMPNMGNNMGNMGAGMMPNPMMMAAMMQPMWNPWMAMMMSQMMGGAGGGMSAGLPQAPGFAPSAADRPVPPPAQKSQIQPGQSTASIPFRGVRRTIANKLRESVNTAVHFTVMDEADVTALDNVRRQIAQQTGEKISFLPFVCAAVCRALTNGFGALNATVDDAHDQVLQHASVHLGIATDTDSGLMVPVIRNAQAMHVVQLAKAIAHAAASARDRSAPREALTGSTFTISNVGSHAGRFATPVINAPEVGILAVGRVSDGVVVQNGQAMVGKVMPLSLACDHRVVDGATAALALAQIIRSLQQPQF